MGIDGLHGEEDETGTGHVPVLLEEVLEVLAPKLGKVVVDGTLGGGGHTAALLGKGAMVVGLDWDAAALRRVHKRLGCEVDAGMLRLVHGGYDEIGAVAEKFGLPPLDGILLDLGVSSDQLDDPARGLSYHADGPLDMRLDSRARRTAADILARESERELARILWEYGEERKSRPLAALICTRRKSAPLETTRQLLKLVEELYPPRPGLARAHPAARIFQALRIAVNDELGQLQRALAAAPGLLKAGGRLAVITFQPEEDRAVKAGFRAAGDGFKVWKKILPGAAEVERNPRARSAKLRVLERVR
jgi:16S rRNA (cytosine1402-N4)-methyltransferase